MKQRIYGWCLGQDLSAVYNRMSFMAMTRYGLKICRDSQPSMKENLLPDSISKVPTR